MGWQDADGVLHGRAWLRARACCFGRKSGTKINIEMDVRVQ
jgi:hypothetical protein